MSSNTTDIQVTNKLKEIVKHKTNEYQSKLELIRLSNSDIEFPHLSTEEGYWAAGYDSLNPFGIYADYEGKYTSAKTGGFHITGRLYGLVAGGSSTGAAVLCVYNTLPDKFFDTDLLALYSSGVATYSMSFFYNGLLLATSGGVSFGSIDTLGGIVRATRY